MCGGAGRDRTDDLLNAIQALSQLSYSPVIRVLYYFFDVVVNIFDQPSMFKVKPNISPGSVILNT